MYNNPYYYQQPRYNTFPTSGNQYIPNNQFPDASKMVLNGKLVDNLEAVKVADIPLDGSISYFPLTDGSAIVTKQLQHDGTSKTIIYKPEISEKVDEIKYVTSADLEKALEEINNLKEEIKELKKGIKK